MGRTLGCEGLDEDPNQHQLGRRRGQLQPGHPGGLHIQGPHCLSSRLWRQPWKPWQGWVIISTVRFTMFTTFTSTGQLETVLEAIPRTEPPLQLPGEDSYGLEQF